MAVYCILSAVTLLMAVFVGVWIRCPGLRAWMEMPKHSFLEQQRRYPRVVRGRRVGRKGAPRRKRRRPKADEESTPPFV
jgi:hypothetical protein